MIASLPSFSTRSWLLSVWLLLLAFFNFTTARSYALNIYEFIARDDYRFTGVFRLGIYGLLFVAVLSILFVAGMWWMRKWGFYGYMALQGVAFIIALILGAPLVTLLIPLGGLAILYWLVMRRWQHFR